MKIQTEFLRIGEATTYHEQYFKTQTLQKISTDQWMLIQNLLDDLAEILSNGNRVDVEVKILENED